MYSIRNNNKKTSSIYTISWTSHTDPLFLQSIKHVIPHAIFKDGYCIDLMATSICSVDSMEFDYDMLVLLAKCISNQIIFMEKRRQTFIGFELADILCVGDSKHFFIANSARIVSWDTRISVPFIKPTFTSPEIRDLIKLPAYVSALTGRYSLATLIVALLGGSPDAIKYTKLYWFLHRCLSYSPIFALV
jgi:hypothetical protein